MPSPRGRTRATRRRRKARSPGAHRRSAIGMPAARRPSERTVRSIAGTVGVCTQWRRLPVDLLYFLYLALRPSVSDPRHCASSRAQFGDRPRDRTPNRSCDVAASGACRCWPTNLPTIWSVRAASAERRRRRSAKALADGSSRFRTEALAGPAALRRRLMTPARTRPRRAADLPQRRSALPQTSWREFGEFRDSCGTALSCDMTITPQSCPLPDSLRVPVLGPALGMDRYSVGATASRLKRAVPRR